jgi:hypothetical protein
MERQIENRYAHGILGLGMMGRNLATGGTNRSGIEHSNASTSASLAYCDAYK